MDHLDIDIELKFAAGDGDAIGSVEGYGSVFGLLDRGGDIVMPGSFRKSLAAWRGRKSMPAMLWQHDPHAVIGVWKEIAEDDKGLRVKGELILDIPKACEARALLQRGAMKSLSIGFRTLSDEVDRSTGARRLKEVDLWEISLVTFPMQLQAEIMSVKHAFDPNALERQLRDEAKLSNREAKAAVSVFRKHVLRDGGRNEPAPRDETRDLLMALRATAESLRT